MYKILVLYNDTIIPNSVSAQQIKNDVTSLYLPFVKKVIPNPDSKNFIFTAKGCSPYLIQNKNDITTNPEYHSVMMNSCPFQKINYKKINNILLDNGSMYFTSYDNTRNEIGMLLTQNIPTTPEDKANFDTLSTFFERHNDTHFYIKKKVVGGATRKLRRKNPKKKTRRNRRKSLRRRR